MQMTHLFVWPMRNACQVYTDMFRYYIFTFGTAVKRDRFIPTIDRQSVRSIL